LLTPIFREKVNVKPIRFYHGTEICQTGSL